MSHGQRAIDGLADEDRQLVERIQQHIPLVPRPFAAIAPDLGMTESEVLVRLSALRGSGLIRELSAIFDSRALGYGSTLVAARYAADRLEAAAAHISAHPGVSHNYERGHDFNLWYTLATPPGVPVEAEVERLHGETGALSTRVLPSLRTFKIGVRLGMGEAAGDEREEVVAAARTCLAPCTPLQIAAVRALQDDLPLVSRPFDERATREGFASTAALLDTAEAMRAAGRLRRLAAVLRHRQAGFSANAMVAWRAPEANADRIGEVMATFARVSHCYRRPTYPDWPYNLFTMIHGRAEGDVDACVAAITTAVGPLEHRAIYSLREFKKERVRYFTA